jgi:Domain of unknown function (DUF222)/HNH endonuclease
MFEDEHVAVENVESDPVARADALHATAGRAHRRFLAALAEIDLRGTWEGDGARDAVHWVSMRYGISAWKAARWVAAGHALVLLPRISEALATGQLCLDKVVELTRFATPESESALILWAARVSSGGIRRKADLERKRERSETVDAERTRSVRWWYEEEGTRFGLEAELPADQGALVAKALSRLADSVRPVPGEEGSEGVDARRADALVTLCSGTIARDPDPDRATVVVHASLETLAGSERNAEIEDGPVIAPDTARRLACDGRIQIVAEDREGHALRLGRLTRVPSAPMLRQLRHRDRECRFPGCGKRRFTNAHHVRWWSRGGGTDLDNLLLLCSFHHRLVHEGGWTIDLDAHSNVEWYRPGGARYRAGPAPPTDLSFAL